MKPSLDKLYKFFKLEIERGCDNHAVVGGFERMLDRWGNEARADSLPEDLIQVIVSRLQDYARLSPTSRAEALEGLWKRIQRNQGIKAVLPPFELPEAPSRSQPQPAENTPRQPKPKIQEDSSTPHHQSRQSPGSQPGPDSPSPVIPEQVAPTPAVSKPNSSEQASPKPSTSTKAPVRDIEPAALNAPVTVLSGVGPANAQHLARVGVTTLRDMLYYLPRRYNDYTMLKPINRLEYGDELTVLGTIQSIHQRSLRGGKDPITEAVLSDGTGALRLTWFNNPYIIRRLHQGAQIVLSGKIDIYLGRLVMNNPEWEPVEQQQLSTNRIVPVYPLSQGITQRFLRRTMNQLVTFLAPRLQDPLPETLRRSASLLDFSTAIMQTHFPDSQADLQAARQRLAFDEILMLQLGVLRQKQAWQNRSAQVFTAEPNWLETQIERLPYQLTNAQQRALQDIQHDLGCGRPMNRLIQGDVGSGKTIVAALAIAIVTRQSAQAAIMAPTSILAEQHYKNLLKVLSELNTELVPAENPEDTLPAPPLRPTEIRLMIGATPESEKRQIRDGLASGEIKLIIGTHALIEAPVSFANLELVVVDEQHRFGVEQRAELRAKGANPHLLVMTATPIPRSLALTVYGDLDLTVMDELPPGRQQVGTYVLLPRERERAYALVRNQVQQGRQAFMVFPLVEESEKSDAKAAVEEHARLQSEFFPNLRLGLLHGRMRPEEKDEIMTAFRDGSFDILVSTSVIEVGVDVPNATVMVIEGANRFGLAQLHQFRGRVGRGSEKSYCILIPDQPDAAENERLQAMVDTNDGFVLAERDLEQRGPGQFLGSRQSGFTELKVANITDVHLIEKARHFALTVFEQDSDLLLPENQLLKAAMQRAWGETQGDFS